MDALTREQRLEALKRYADAVDDMGGALRSLLRPVPYDVCPRLGEAPWHVSFGGMMVIDELRELANLVNAWARAIWRWNAWIGVMEQSEDELAWSVQLEFVEPIAFHCMYMPAAVRDRFIHTATNAFHQARMTVDSAYPDHLKSDPPAAGKSAKVLGRHEGEKQLGEIASRWPSGAKLLTAIRRLDDATYRQATSNFRNLASHAIAPHFQLGLTNTVVRRVVPTTTLVAQADGSYREAVVPNSLSVSYGVGGTGPLAMCDMLDLALKQFSNAKACFAVYAALLDEALDEMVAQTKVSTKSQQEP